jgi:Mg-chelatase subunit ChlD
MKKQKLSRESGVAIYVFTIFLMLIVPMIGLGIDASLLYVVKTRLQGAVDGAALAGSKALSQGTDDATEAASAVTAANVYVRVNYPSTFFFSQDVNINGTTGVVVDYTSVPHQRTVTVTASVVEPTLFMQWLNFMSTTVWASAQTVRKDLNVVLVMDRSNSLEVTSSCVPVQNAAQLFVTKFSPGRDQVGLVTFASSAEVNFAPATTFASASPNVTTMIGNMTCSGSTSTAMGLWLGYQQLIALNEPTAANILVLFTDGEPTAVNVNMPIAKASTCTAYTAGAPSGPGGYTVTTATKGYLPGLYNTFTDASTFFGLLDPFGTTSSNGGNQLTNGTDNVIAPNYTNCYFASGGTNLTSIPSQMEAFNDFSGLAVTDIYGNSLTGADVTYMSVTTNSLGFVDLTNSSNAQNMAFNVADDAGWRIRNGKTDGTVGAATNGKSLSGVIIFTVGLQQASASYPFSSTFLYRMANDPNSGDTSYDSTLASGKFFLCQSVSDLNSAFLGVASEILRISK